MFPGCNSKKLYHYLDPTLENENFGNAIIYVGMSGIINRDSSKLLQLLEYLKKILEKRFSYGIENVFISSEVFNKRPNRYFLEQVNTKVANLLKKQ